MNSLGRDAASCSDLMSYLLFASKYTTDLIELGYRDASQSIHEIEDFLFSIADKHAEPLPSARRGNSNGKSRAKQRDTVREIEGVPTVREGRTCRTNALLLLRR